MTTTTEPATLRLSLTDVPAKKVPNGLWFDVLHVLRAHGLDAEAMEVVSAVTQIVRHTPTDRGGRLRPDGSIDHDDQPDLGASWYCALHGKDMYSEAAKAEHDQWCRAMTTATAGEQLHAIMLDLDRTSAAWVAAGYGFDTPEYEAREAVFARLNEWNRRQEQR